jgi:hypothetical protein
LKLPLLALSIAPRVPLLVGPPAERLLRLLLLRRSAAVLLPLLMLLCALAVPLLLLAPVMISAYMTLRRKPDPGGYSIPLRSCWAAAAAAGVL